MTPEPPAGPFVLDVSLWLPAAPDRVFPYFADAVNLERLTPPWLHFRIVNTEPIVMRVGTFIDYRLRLHGIPLSWRTCITEWDPPRAFVDEQIRGPYRLWRHRHTFTAENGGTRCDDHVDYDMTGGVVADRLLVRRDLARIFAFRRQVLLWEFGDGQSSPA